MKSLSASDVVTLWERAMRRPWVWRALVLLSAADPERDPDALMAMAISRRDLALLQLREALFGSTLECITQCVACADLLELTLAVEEIRPAFASKALNADRPRKMQVDDFEVWCRPFSNGDFVRCGHVRVGESDVNDALVRMCVLEARELDHAVLPESLPEPVVAALADTLGDAEYRAGIDLELTCPNCSHRWESTFDIVTFLWAELEAKARETLADIHTLARAYGWSESDILAMPPSRRRIYLDLVESA
jgi:hypothetical protein